MSHQSIKQEQDQEITDAYMYTHEMILQNLILLEDHFKSYPCPDCIQKHIQSLRGYLREAIDLAPEEHKQFWVNLKDEFYDWSSDPGTDDLNQWSKKIREFRKRVMHDIHLEQNLEEQKHHARLKSSNGSVASKRKKKLECVPCGVLAAIGLGLSDDVCSQAEMDPTDNYCSRRIRDPDYFDPDSIRTVVPECKDWAEQHNVPLSKAEEKCPPEIEKKGHKVRVGCPKGEYDNKSQRCEVGMETQSVLHPKEEVKKELKKHKTKKHKEEVKQVD